MAPKPIPRLDLGFSYQYQNQVLVVHYKEMCTEVSKKYIEQENRTAVGRFLTGMGLGMTLTIPNVYIVEVTDPQYRGVLGYGNTDCGVFKGGIQS